jgi:hypothetical protein
MALESLLPHVRLFSFFLVGAALLGLSPIAGYCFCILTVLASWNLRLDSKYSWKINS